MHRKNILGCWLLWLITQPATAVEINHQGLGEVLIFPYYSVNNNLNTIYALVNTTPQAKAVKVSFHEGDVGLEVLSFHVYLRPHDVFTASLGAGQSTSAGHEGELTALHATADYSCRSEANYLMPFNAEVIDADLDPDNHHMARTLEGYFVAIEMGVFTGVSEAFVEGGFERHSGRRLCDDLRNAWSDGTWALEPLRPPEGGLSGSAGLINVFEGLYFSYDALAIQNFWAGPGLFTPPGAHSPNLDSGDLTSRVLMTDGSLATSRWSSGYQAISALLMKSEIRNEYTRDASIRGKTDWVVSFPTKYFHVSQQDAPVPPFSESWNGTRSCDTYSADLYDREQRSHQGDSCCIEPPPPRPPEPAFCYATNVSELLLPDEQSASISPVLGSENLSLIQGYYDWRETENGWGVQSFTAPEMIMVPESGVTLQGLPMTGFAVQQYTNGGAANGLLAQYGSLFMHRGRVTAMEGDQ